MSTAGIIASLVILVAGLVYVFYPMFVRIERLGLLAQTQKGRDELLARYERVISIIRDLDEDNATGKINADEYQAERALWSQRGVEVLKALEAAGVNISDTKHSLSNGNDADKDADSTLDDDIEEAISKYVSALSE